MNLILVNLYWGAIRRSAFSQCMWSESVCFVWPNKSSCDWLRALTRVKIIIQSSSSPETGGCDINLLTPEEVFNATKNEL